MAASTRDADPSAERPDRLLDAWREHVSTEAEPYHALIARHRQPHRRYHTVEHVESVVAHVRRLAAAVHVGDLGATIAAAFFHDAIYEPPIAGNERASAQLAIDELGRLGWSAERIARVGETICATAHHRDPPDLDQAVLFDADLAVLGASPEVYHRYVESVRAEYAHVDDAAWTAGRRAVLDGFLARPMIFATPLGRRRWERAARSNLAAEVASLTDPR